MITEQGWGNGSSGPRRPLALVTGASSGIGLHLAHQCAANGFDVLMVAEDERLTAATIQVREACAARADVSMFRTDLASATGVRSLCDALATARPLDALLLNAGVGVGGPFVDTRIDEDVRLLELNVVGLVRLAKVGVRQMVDRGRGRVLITASVASTMPGPYYATYAASKAFGLSFAEALREEVAPFGVSVTALMPGPTDTDFFRRAGMEHTRVGRGPKDDPARVAAEGFAAMMAGDDHVVAGSTKNKLQVLGSKLLSDPARAKVHARSTREQATSAS